MSRLSYCSRRLFTIFSFDIVTSVSLKPSYIVQRNYAHEPRTSSRFKWPHQGFMPSRTPYPLFPAISTADEAKGIVSYLTEAERSLLLVQLQKLREEKDFDGSSEDSVQPISTAQLYSVFLVNCLPFIGFGLLDNAIMIIAGEYIDATIGAALGISTMAAAALGNLVSDIAGVGSTAYVELLVSKLGVTPPNLSVQQSRTRSARWSVNMGRVVGITVGCLLGMLPLLFYPNDDSKSSLTSGSSEQSERLSLSSSSSSMTSTDSSASGPATAAVTRST